MNLPAHIKGLVFDCDGTLADTMPLHWRAWQVIAAKYKLHFPEDRFYSLGGVPSRDILQMLAKEQGVTLDHIAAAHEKENEYLPLMTTVRTHPCGCRNCPRRTTAKSRWPSRPAAHSPIIEQSAGAFEKIRHLFGAVVTSEMVKHQKPAPDIFVEAARLIGVDPKFCRRLRRYLDLGVQAIRSAGMEAVDVRELLQQK